MIRQMEKIDSLLEKKYQFIFQNPLHGNEIAKYFLCAFLILNIVLLPLLLYAESTNNPVSSTAINKAKNEIDKSYIEYQITKLQQDMIIIKAGSFMMGASNRNGDHDELPVHRVNIDEFKMGRYEVTFAQWDACVADGGCNGRRAYDKGWGREDRPVIHVNWDDTQNFIKWLNEKTGKQFRLLSEAEWEYAARAGTNTTFSWGDYTGNNHANCKGCGSPRLNDTTLPVGSFEANQFGLYDMHGNVWEWVADCWNNTYVGAPVDGSAWISGNCDYRVIRGGSYFSLPPILRSSNRSFNIRTFTASEPGFRLAHD